MLEGAGSRNFLVVKFVIRFWIVGFMGVVRFAMRGPARLAGHAGCTGVGAGGRRRRGSAVTVCLGVVSPVRRGLGVGGMCVREGAILGSVGSAPCKGREHALVGRGSMKGCLVMLQCPCVGLPVIRCSAAGTIGALKGATAVCALRLVGLL